MPFDVDRVVVCVPAKDEAERIGRLLASLATQSLASSSHPLKVVVVCNNTHDETASVARGFAAKSLALKIVEVDLPPDLAHVGTGRRMAMDIAAAWLDETSDLDGVLISTDADAVPPSAWVGANLAALANAEIVGGRLVIADDARGASHTLSQLHEKIERYWAAVRELEDCIDPPAHDLAPRHGDHTGASLALRVSTYRRAGGMPPIPSGEDVALVTAIERLGGRLRHCPAVWVAVSAREEGRATAGMALEMTRRRRVAATAGTYELPTAAFWRDRLLHRAALRADWVNDGEFPNAIAYVACREASFSSKPAPAEPIDAATTALEAMAHRLRRGHAA